MKKKINQPKGLPNWYALLLMSSLLSLFVLVYFSIQMFYRLPAASRSILGSHKSYPNTQSATIAPGSALSQEADSVASDQPQSSISMPTKEYGIAAGGGLTYLNQEELDRYFDLLQSLGVRWVRWDIDWSAIQPNNSVEYNWEEADRVAITAKRYGINSLGIITYAPKWAAIRSCNSSKQRCAPADPGEFGRFAGETASHYRGIIFYWEIWNEPNLPFFWGPRPDAKGYADVLREAYIEIKKADPLITVLSGGLATSVNEKDGGISPVAFSSSLYALGANQYFDAIAIHPYTYPALPSYEAGPNHWRDIPLTRQLMVDNGDEAKKIWLTELGAPTGGPGRSFAANQIRGFKIGSDFVTEEAQLDLMTEVVDFYDQNFDWLGPFFWYSLRDDGDIKDTPENFFGLLRYDGSKKPAFDVFQNTVNSND